MERKERIIWLIWCLCLSFWAIIYGYKSINFKYNINEIIFAHSSTAMAVVAVEKDKVYWIAPIVNGKVDRQKMEMIREFEMDKITGKE